MDRGILSEEVQAFIDNNIDVDLQRLILKGSPFADVRIQDIAQQIQGIRVAQNKFPQLASSTIVFPASIHLQQTSSKQTANYKRNLFQPVHSFVDITGGFGVDAFYLSKIAKESHYCETNESLFTIATHNFKHLNKSIKTHHINGIDFIQNKHFDLLFMDPSRRHERKGKVVALEDCEPNLIKHWDKLLQSSKQILAKLSPLLDLRLLRNTLSNIVEIHVVSVKNDVKEILVKAERNYLGETKIVASNIHEKQVDSYKKQHDQPILFTNEISSKGFIYEPYSVLLKSNLQDSYAIDFDLQKIGQNSNFYYANDQYDTALAKIYQIKQTLSFNKKRILQALPEKSVNVICRNFPLKPDEVLNKLGMKQGGKHFLLCTTKNKKPIVFLCSQIKS